MANTDKKTTEKMTEQLCKHLLKDCVVQQIADNLWSTNLEPVKHKAHDLFTRDDFTQAEINQDNPLARMVVKEDRQVCRRCEKVSEPNERLPPGCISKYHRRSHVVVQRPDDSKSTIPVTVSKAIVPMTKVEAMAQREHQIKMARLAAGYGMGTARLKAMLEDEDNG